LFFQDAGHGAASVRNEWMPLSDDASLAGDASLTGVAA